LVGYAGTCKYNIPRITSAFHFAAASNYIYRRGYSGNISFKGGGIANRVISEVEYGNIKFTGIGASNIVESDSKHHKCHKYYHIISIM
jgi:hypothetical protein